MAADWAVSDEVLMGAPGDIDWHHNLPAAGVVERGSLKTGAWSSARRVGRFLAVAPRSGVRRPVLAGSFRGAGFSAGVGAGFDIFTEVSKPNREQPMANHLPSNQYDLTRRQAVATRAAGFALAVRPISAETITTSDEGLLAGEVQIPTPDGEIPAYMAAPKAGGPFPVVLVVQEIFGVHEHIKDVCRRFAKLGYLAVAPELYFRQGDVSKMSNFSEIISKVVAKVPDNQVLADLDAAVTWAKNSGHGDTAKLAITGFCWGGRIVWLYAAHNPNLKAGVAWYGRLDSQKDDLHPTQPIDLVGELKAPVLGLYGGADQGIPNELVAKMQEKLKAAGKPSEIILYPDTPHGFYADYRPSYRKDQADDGWKKLQEWFRKHGAK